MSNFDEVLTIFIQTSFSLMCKILAEHPCTNYISFCSSYIEYNISRYMPSFILLMFTPMFMQCDIE